MDTERLKRILAAARSEIGKVIIGQQRVTDMALITIVTGSHALIEGVPGVAKTLLVRTLGKVLGCEMKRIQFTPDLMPADLIGTNVFNFSQNAFVLVRGPVFTAFLLADEINRAPAKTQSGRLPAMQERQVTIDRETYPLSANFTVFATQNPVEYEGTYPLPEAQKDRFMFKIPMACPEREEELTLARRMLGAEAPEAVLASEAVRPVLGADELVELRQSLATVTLREELIAYIVDIVRATRTDKSVLVGAGPRATQSLTAACRACAVLAERDFVVPDDIKDMAVPALAHRLILRPEFEIEGLTVEEAVRRLLQEVPVPR
jgi:MoxR-like ATPase